MLEVSKRKSRAEAGRKKPAEARRKRGGSSAEAGLARRACAEAGGRTVEGRLDLGVIVVGVAEESFDNKNFNNNADDNN